MTTIRPILPQSLPSTAAPKPADAARLAAQKAFFEIAAGRAAAAPAPVPMAVGTNAPSTVTRAAPPLTPAPDLRPESSARPLRPGSLLDIRV